jgi:recombination protein RecT
VVAHAKRYSRSYGSEASAWATNFDEMAEKTVLRDLLSHFGIMSIEMAVALAVDTDEAELGHEIDESANKDILDVIPPATALTAGEAPGKVEEAPF